MKVNKLHAIALISILSLSAVALIGFNIWNTFILSKISVLSDFALLLLILFSILAGIASFFAPCGIVLLPSFVSYTLASIKTDKTSHPPWSYFVGVALYSSAGILSFFFLLGAAISVFGTVVNAYLLPIQYLVAILFIVFGALLLKNHSFNSPMLESLRTSLHKRASSMSGNRGFYLFGFAYGLDAIGCLFPLVFALLLFPLLSGTYLTSILSITAYALGISATLTLATFLISRGKNEILKLSNHTSTIKKIAGTGLLIGGTLLFLYYLFFGMPIPL